MSGEESRNQRGSSEDRRRRKAFLLETYRADVDVIRIVQDTPRGVETYGVEVAHNWAGTLPIGYGIISAEVCRATRCFHCGCLLFWDTLTVDRIIPGCKQGTYRRNNIRPACWKHNTELGSALGHEQKRLKKEKAA